MTENLVIVESPAKAKTIKKYLGKDFEVLASYGHVRDLVPKEGAVDPEHGFAMQYQELEKSARHVDAISRALRKAKALYLATDPDREGEAIAWHLHEILKSREQLAGKKVHRGLSAGRVQSPALRMICEREAEIAAFNAQEYWTLDGEGEHTQQRFPVKLIEYLGTKVEQFSFVSEAQAREVERTIKTAAGADGATPGELTVLSIDRKQRRRNPAPPFTTSTLQQEAARKLGFNARRTMRLAQQLYEGVDLGEEGSVGLITYMRTDSVSLAAEAVSELRAVAAKLFGPA